MFEYVSGDVNSHSEQELLQFLKMVFATLRESGKLDVNVKIIVES